MISKAITEARIILSLLNEAVRDKTFLSLDLEHSPANGPFIVSKEMITLSFQIGSETKNQVSCHLWTQDAYYQWQSNVLGPKEISVPAQINQIDRRTTDRIHADDLEGEVIAIVSSDRGKAYGFLEDFNANHLKIKMAKSIFTNKGKRVQLYHHGNLLGDCQVTETPNKESSPTNDHSFVFRILNPPPVITREAHRGENHAPVNVSLSWPDRNGYSTLVKISEVSGGGMSGECIDHIPDILPVGFIFVERVTGARIRLAWKTQTKLGFSFDTMDETSRLLLLHHIRSVTTDAFSISSKRAATDSLRVMSRAGLLKSDRLTSYENAAKKAMFNGRSNFSDRWHCAFQQQGTFISYVRISDEIWLIQELASTSEKGSGEKLLLESIQRFISTTTEHFGPSDSILGIYDITSPFNLKLWHDVIPSMFDGQIHRSSVYLGSIANVRVSSTINNSDSTVQATRASAKQWSKLAIDLSNKPYMNQFGVRKHDFNAPFLASVLRSDNLRLEREVHLISDEGSAKAVVIKVGLPPLSNASSLAENLYIFPLTAEYGTPVAQYLMSDHPSLLGVEDICIFSEHREQVSIIEESLRHFKARAFEASLLPIWCFEAKQ